MNYNENDWLQFFVALPWVLFLAVLGGFVGFIRRLNESKEKQPLGFIFVRLLSEIVISVFAGIVTFLICKAWSIEPLYTAVAVAISGHAGGRAIDSATDLVKKRFKIGE
ncbi:hypothetical protein B0181_04985 [Moraxella caviae]|uniref:Holin n=1 Tax=Moraxella caviae TaxID=34060 RepID=A0A1T0A3T9_9GAMM|nr:phage holin family protein [Moraxella caviae]OOR90229.1 hypothetical protein B0181_04985 [Moraxella caviae]STZ14550.1 Uncharacterised protein [Moraxella caviae]VEW12555.1 Uncharacterised protein [Moraxella caviae]